MSGYFVDCRDDEEGECEQCGARTTNHRRLCGDCRTDNTDLYADASYQDSVDGE
jgi:hypothetical protein